MTLADGRPLAVLATDRDLDVAALRAPAPGRRWLALSGGRPRLGERVHAAGFPYYSIAGTSLNLTGGNVSALAGVDDDARFFSFTAPVQPGNSGGPLIDARGAVVGLVVARLSEDYIVETTGTLPQNINYAVGEDALAGFLARSELVHRARRPCELRHRRRRPRRIYPDSGSPGLRVGSRRPIPAVRKACRRRSRSPFQCVNFGSTFQQIRALTPLHNLCSRAIQSPKPKPLQCRVRPATAAPKAWNSGRETGSLTAFHSGCHCTAVANPEAPSTTIASGVSSGA